MPDNVQEHLGANEAVFRRINEEIERGHWPGEEEEPVSFRCECARLGCNELVELSVREYESVRSHARRFIVRPGHERPDIETVVEQSSAYLVVEKVAQAGEKAAESDPRATSSESAP